MLLWLLGACLLNAAAVREAWQCSNHTCLPQLLRQRSFCALRLLLLDRERLL